MNFKVANFVFLKRAYSKISDTIVNIAKNAKIDFLNNFYNF